MSFGTLLQKLRKEQGLTLKELSEKVGSSKGYLSGIENEKVNPPSEKFVRKLARILGVDEIEFLKMAYLEKVPAALRTEFNGQTTTETVPTETLNRIRQDSGVTLLNTVGTGYPTDIEGAIPKSLVECWISLPQLNPNQHLALTVIDNSMLGDDQRGYGEGDVAILDRTETPSDGDCVYVIYNTREGRAGALRQVLQQEGENLVLQPFNKQHSLHFLNQDDVEAVFRVVGKVAFYANRTRNSISSTL
jgi:transcriptional regulator with XRE-family HTH domain